MEEVVLTNLDSIGGNWRVPLAGSVDQFRVAGAPLHIQHCYQPLASSAAGFETDLFTGEAGRRASCSCHACLSQHHGKGKSPDA